MLFYLTGLNPFALFVLIFGGICLFTLGLYTISKHLHSFENKKDWIGERYISSFFTIIGALVGVILGMVLVTIWQNYQKEKDSVNDEALNFYNIYKLSERLNKENGDSIRIYIKEITKRIIMDSWPRMNQGKEGVEAPATFEKLQLYLNNIEVDNSKQESVINAILKKMEKAIELGNNRNMKAVNSMIPDEMWFVIFFCIFISITSGFYFRIEPQRVQTALIILHCLILSVVIFLIISLTYPYRGGTHITAEPFERILNVAFPKIDKELERI